MSGLKDQLDTLVRFSAFRVAREVEKALPRALDRAGIRRQTGKLRKAAGRAAGRPRFSRYGWEIPVRIDVDHAVFVDRGTRPHPIEARRRRFLRFEVEGRTVFARRVFHPGTRRTGFFTNTLTDGFRGWLLLTFRR